MFFLSFSGKSAIRLPVVDELTFAQNRFWFCSVCETRNFRKIISGRKFHVRFLLPTGELQSQPNFMPETAMAAFRFGELTRNGRLFQDCWAGARCRASSCGISGNHLSLATGEISPTQNFSAAENAADYQFGAGELEKKERRFIRMEHALVGKSRWKALAAEEVTRNRSIGRWRFCKLNSDFGALCGCLTQTWFPEMRWSRRQSG